MVSWQGAAGTWNRLRKPTRAAWIARQFFATWRSFKCQERILWMQIFFLPTFSLRRLATKV